MSSTQKMEQEDLKQTIEKKLANLELTAKRAPSEIEQKERELERKQIEMEREEMLMAKKRCSYRKKGLISIGKNLKSRE